MFCLPGIASEDLPVQVKVARFYNPSRPDTATTERLIELMRHDPQLQVTKWGGLSLPGGAGRASVMMAIAGQTAPDVMESWFHIIRNDIDQGFLYPLNEWIGDDTNGNGQIDDDEAKWERWKSIPLLWRRVATINGKVYAIPQASVSYMGVIFRTDLVRAAGLDASNPPQTWDELEYWCQKLTDPAKQVPGAVVQRGQRGIALTPYGFTWLPWMQAAGGDPIVQSRLSPTTGRESLFSMEATTFTSSDGEDLSGVEPTWRANVADAQGVEAAALFHRLRWDKWMIHPDTHEPIRLSAEDIARGNITVNKQTLTFTPDDVITGVARSQTGQRGTNAFDLLSRGEVAMLTWFVQDLVSIGNNTGIDPSLLSWFPFPAGPHPNGREVVQVQRHYAVMTEGVSRRPKRERDKVWQVLTAVTDQQVADQEVRQRVLSGLANFVNPLDLKRLGFEDYLKDVPRAIQHNFQGIASGQVNTFTEPYMGFWVTMDGTLDRKVLSLILAETGEHFDYTTALKDTQELANNGLMFARSEEELARYRPWARVVFAVMALIMITFVVLIIRSLMKKKTGGTAVAVDKPFIPILLMGPALILIGMWSYYPLLRGMVMAFQDYRIVGDSEYVGLDHFITIALDPTVWVNLWRTIQFVVLNVIFAFTAPIILAVMLSEVPRGKVFYRTLFFLPQVTSGLVIALIWKLLYDPTPQGTLNQFVTMFNVIPFVHIEPQTWLQDPRLAMMCCIIPTVWASMGMASLIYLAALRAVPEEIYEAAEVDGAGIWTKLRCVTFPTLMPLILINFVGVFIATFQNMGNIFLLTFGGPGDSTMVFAMRIWIEAYNNLRFGLATTLAWILGSLLIGFTYMQIRILRRVEFRKANWD
jgi:multiple sugar transport system permease protein